jgi:O-antigen ligase
MQNINLIFFFFILLVISVVFSVAILNCVEVLLILFFFIASIKNKDFLKTITQKNYFGIWLFFLYLFFQSIIINDINNLTIGSIFGFLKNSLFFISFIYFFNKNDLDLLFKFYLFIILMVSLDIIFQYIFGFNTIGYRMINFTGDLKRFSGFFGKELVAGAFLSKIIFIPILALIKNYKSKYLNNVALIIFFLSLIAILLTGDRMAIINSLVISTIALIILAKKRYILIIISCLVFLLLTQKNLLERNFDNTFEQYNLIKNDLNNSNNNKIDSIYLNHYFTAIKLWENNFFFGNGIRSFRFKCEEVANHNLNFFGKRLNLANGCSTHPHNYYLEIVSETGVIGLIILVYFFAYNLFYKVNFNSKINLVLILSILVILNPIQTTGSFFTSWNSFFIWQMLAIFKILSKD